MSGKPGMRSRKGTEVLAAYNGDFMDALDGRVKVARSLRQRLQALTNDLAGIQDLSYQEQSLCKRAIHLERLIEKRELSLAHGGPIDEQSYLSAITTLSALFSKLGLRRRAKIIGGTLAERLSQQQGPAL